MSTIHLCLLCNVVVSVAMIAGIVALYPMAGGYAFWLLLALLGQDTIRKSGTAWKGAIDEGKKP